MSSSCTRKRKLNADDDTKELETCTPPKKRKLDATKDEEESFEIMLGNEEILKLFASNTVNNNNKEKDNKNDKLISMDVGKSEWKFEFFELPTDENKDVYIFLDGLFGDKLCDWKEYIIKDKDNAQTSNNFIAVIMDNLGVWRGAILFIVYQIRCKQMDECKYLIKIPLTGVDLHFRRQNVGRILVNYLVAIIDKIMNFEHEKYEIIVLVIDEDGPRSFWTKCGFVSAVTHCDIFEKERMKKKGFVHEIEQDLVIMIYAGTKSVDLVFENEMIQSFETPKYVNFNQRYCKRNEVEQTEKLHKEWAKKKKEIERKKKEKRESESEESDDEDFDVEEAMKNMSSDEDDDDDEYDDE